MKESIVRLRALEKQRFAYRYALNVVDFDAETVAPEGSADGRAEACEVLSRADFDLLVNDNTAALLRQAAQDAETEQERAEVRELQRAYDQISKIPADEYAAFTKLTQQSIPAWVKAKRTNDFSVFAPYLEKIVAARRAQAHYFAPDRDPYEVLLDQYEHGLTPSARSARRSCSCGAWTRPTATWPRANIPLPPSSGAAMCASPPITCPAICSVTCTAWPTRAVMPCTS